MFANTFCHHVQHHHVGIWEKHYRYDTDTEGWWMATLLTGVSYCPLCALSGVWNKKKVWRVWRNDLALFRKIFGAFLGKNWRFLWYWRFFEKCFSISAEWKVSMPEYLLAAKSSLAFYKTGVHCVTVETTEGRQGYFISLMIFYPLIEFIIFYIIVNWTKLWTELIPSVNSNANQKFRSAYSVALADHRLLDLF